MIQAFVDILNKHLSKKKKLRSMLFTLTYSEYFKSLKVGHLSAVRSSKMTNNLKSSTYISIRSCQYFYWPDDLVSWFLKLECLRLQKKQNTSLPHGGVLQEKLGGGVRHSSWNRYPISDQNKWISLPYFRPDQKFDLSDLKRDRSAWQAVTASTWLA